jgi:hypothetical protein
VSQRIQRFGIAQTAKVLGILYAMMGLVFLPLFVVANMLSPIPMGFNLVVAILVPVLYGIFGFIFTAIACALYNWVASFAGGVEVQLDG